MHELTLAFGRLMTPETFGYMALGTTLGIIVGAIPGLTGAMLIALTLPLTFTMEPEPAMVLLVSMYVGSVSGGLITATLLRMPGTPASMMTTLDGYPMAQSGRPGRALGLGITASLVGGLISWCFLVMLAGPIARWSTTFGPFEFFSLVMVALVLIASVSGRSLLLGVFSGMLGILLTMPGVSPSTGRLRWTFDFAELNGGLQLLPVLIGLFAVSKIIDDVMRIDERLSPTPMSRRGMFMTLSEWKQNGVNLIRSSLIGTWIGILPGIGANIGSVMAYSAARNLSKTPERFGQGAEEGVIASEAANNATVGGALIPLVSMGIPGSVIDAILLGALVVHGLQPGPRLMVDHPDVVHTIMATMLVANLFMAVAMIAAVGWLAKLMVIPRAFLVPVILVFCVVGSYGLSNRMFDVWVMLAFGAIGFAMERMRIPLSPLVIGFVLAPIAEENLASGLMLSGGSYLPIVTRPVSALFFSVSMALLIWPFARRMKRRKQPPEA
jgi:putative tricarboxylic transport membrane protein